jgi:hypothetical protein
VDKIVKNPKRRRWSLKLKLSYQKILICVAIMLGMTFLGTPMVSAMVTKQVQNAIHYLNSIVQGVTITAIPIWGSMPITDFHVSEYEGDVTCEWSNPPTSANTEVRAKYGSEVTSLTDGYLVYYGPAATCQDLGVYTDELISSIYYSAWAINGAGVYSTPDSDVLEASMLALILVTAGLIGLAFWQRSNFLFIVCGMIAIGFGVYWISQNPGFIYVMEGTAAVALGFYMIIDTAVALVRR